MSNPQAQGSQVQGQQMSQLLKADDISKLQHLTEDQKQKYRPAVANVWNIMQNKPAGSQEHNQARAKLAEWSQRLIAQERTFRNNAKRQGQGGQQAQQSQQPSAPAQEQPQQQSQHQAQPQQQQQPAPRQQQQNPQQPQINPEIIKHVQAFPYHLPLNAPQAGTPEGDRKLKELRNSYLMALNKQEKSTHRVKAYGNMMEQRRQAGQDIPQELINQKTAAETEYNSAKQYVDDFRKRQAQWKAEHEAQRAQQQQQQPQQPAQPRSQQSQGNIAPVKQEPQIKVEGGSQPQQTQQFGNMPQGGQQPQQSTQGPAPSMNQPAIRQPPAPHSQQQQQPGQTGSFTQPGQPQQPQRPQINPQQANAHQQAQNNSPHPQSAASNAAGPPVPLSHRDAMTRAQNSYSNPDPQRTVTPQQVGQGSFHAPGSREREQLNNPKMPIPRTLNVTQPIPVSMGQSRPTMNGPNGAPGMIGQPVINKFPQFQLEGEGDRVLSKRKLDELVRQVTGGGEGPGGESLTPEVEEAMLQLADDFVDTVISSACKLSKLRESPQLDIRDIQLVLERNYNIRIPGYASDEIRTVRKLHPAPGWTQKMNAVQAAKVMGGKTDI
ncbi:hypothetical protein K469DRAFT_7076 [Zopfia rhizophila CBS 207.26]|uniref:Transcription initiation factor TFIID subunit 12 domain-containing protein n=1 Tax=Zopfia rhizophila CBS 207.26 TaxID=1314779 RepID=A0A6A6EWV7_9PEZI|nr:hypothetical protein K469DRAFT_7076 [Zopfia rhizophila CBS 207.26]